MPRLAANLSMLFTELPVLERFPAAARNGFKGVEMLFPYGHPATTIASACRDAGTEMVLINTPAGDWESGMRGLAALPGEEAAFDRALDQACAYLDAFNCPLLHVMAGILPPGEEAGPYWETYKKNLQKAASRLASLAVTITIEPLNSRDVPNYLLSHQRQAAEVIAEVGAENLGLQLDLYHCQIMEGDLARHIWEMAPITRHIQVAGAPDRHEPDTGEINYEFIFCEIDNSDYCGWIGCEYHPIATTESGLGWRRLVQSNNKIIDQN